MRLPFFRENRVYLDYGAATPVAPEVSRVMRPYFNMHFGNPGSIHAEGQRAHRAVAAARGRIARTLLVQPHNITFTSGGTESNNLAIIGTVEQMHREGRAYTDIEVITTKIEHPSVLKSIAELQTRGVTVTHAPVDGDGFVVEQELKKLLSSKTALVSIGYVNGEVGTVERIKRLARVIRGHNTEVIFHTDASQAPLWLPCQPDRLGIDLLTLDAGKCYGPKGVGVLVHRSVKFSPQTHGGGQERGLRSGTENVPLIVGCAEAIDRAQQGCVNRSARVQKLRNLMLTRIQEDIPEAILNGQPEERVANNVNISIPGLDSEYAVVVLDVHGIAASTRSACGSKESAGSHVVREIGDDARAISTIRFTLGEETTKRDITKAVSVLKSHVKKSRTFLTLG